MPALDVGALTVHYSQSGPQNAPALVFINSLGTDLRIWDDVISNFASNFHIVRYDKRGHGLSDVAAQPSRLGDYTADLTNLLDQLHILQVIPIGISLGGLIAIDFALSHPGRLSALVLCDTAPKIGTAEMWNKRIESIQAQSLEAMGEAILSRWFSQNYVQSNPASYRAYFNMLTRMPVLGYLAACEALRDADLGSQVQEITARTLAICGSEDISTPPDLMRSWVSRLPSAHLEIIEGAGHLVCIERPKQFANLIQTFLSEINHAE